jgi:hypothetical protein
VDGRPRELPVHGEDGLLLAQPGDVRLRDLQVEFATPLVPDSIVFLFGGA